MLTYSIKVKGFIDRTIDAYRGRNVIALRSPSAARSLPFEVFVPWTKLQFTIWIEGIKSTHKIGDLVTLKQIPFIPNKAPFYWKITYINELFADCGFDKDVREPICLTLITEHNIVVSKCPGVLRKLTPEEIELVNLSNTKPQGSA